MSSNNNYSMTEVTAEDILKIYESDNCFDTDDHESEHGRRSARNVEKVDYQKVHSGRPHKPADTQSPKDNEARLTNRINKLEQDLKDRTKGMNSIKEQIRAIKKENKNLKKEVTEHKEQIDRKNKKIEKLQKDCDGENNNQMKRSTETENEKKKSLNEYKEMRKENKTLKDELAEERRKAQETNEMNGNLQKELRSQRELTNLLEAQVKSLTEHTTDDENTNQIEHINTIMDSNGKRVIPMMRDTLPAHFEVANLKGNYNTSELVNYMEKYRNLKEERNIILMGTNDFKQVRGRETTANIIKLKDMKLTNTAFVHIPPQRSNEDEDIQAHTEVSRKLFNRTLDKHFETIAIPEMEEDPKKYLEEDGIHVNKLGAKVMAQRIRQHLTTNQARAQETTDEDQGYTTTPTLTNSMPGRKINNERHTLEVEIENKMMPHIIGKQKLRIRAIEETHNVQLESNQQNTDTTKIKIQGISKEGTEEAKKEIENIIEKRTNEEYLKEKYTNTICHQFQRNQCKFGTQCWYKHPTAEKERTAPPRSILRSPLQKRVKISDYRTPTTSDRQEATSTFQHQTEYRNSRRSRSRSQTRNNRNNTMENRQRYYDHEDARDEERHYGRERWAQTTNERQRDNHHSSERTYRHEDSHTTSAREYNRRSHPRERTYDEDRERSSRYDTSRRYETPRTPSKRDRLHRQ